MQLSRTFLELLQYAARVSSCVHIPAKTQVLAVRDSGNSLQMRGEFPDAFDHDICLYGIENFLKIYNGFSATPNVHLSADGISLSTDHSSYWIQSADTEYVPPIKHTLPTMETIAAFELSVFQQRDVLTQCKRLMGGGGRVGLSIVDGNAELHSLDKLFRLGISESLLCSAVRLEAVIGFDAFSRSLSRQHSIKVEIGVANSVNASKWAVWVVSHDAAPRRSYLGACEDKRTNIRYSAGDDYITI
jgi:hypothetical protein